MPTKKSPDPKRPKRGLFITFEGIDGCGKTTQMKLARRYLNREGYSVIAIREPGSAKVSEKIRRILLDKNHRIDAAPELLLYLAARGQLVTETIIPALEKGQIVLCDRFHDSTVAYQGYGRGLDLKFIESLRRKLVGSVNPDLTFVFDIDLKTSMTRRKSQADRLERESELFFKRVRAGFRAIARANPRRVRLINAKPTAEKIFQQVLTELDKTVQSASRKIRK